MNISTGRSLLTCPNPNCGRFFKNLTGLRSHVKWQHPTAPPQHTSSQFPYTPGTRNKLQPETVPLTSSKPHYPDHSPLNSSDSESSHDGSPSKEDSSLLASQFQRPSPRQQYFPLCSPLNSSDSEAQSPSSENKDFDPLASPLLSRLPSSGPGPSVASDDVRPDEIDHDLDIFMDTDRRPSPPRSDYQDQDRADSESEPVMTRSYHPKINGA